MARNVTIRISYEAALWARRQAASENTSVSRLVGEMLERQMRLSDHYWRAFDHWKSSRPLAGAGAAGRLSREEAHERREAGARVTEYSGSNPGLGLESGESGSIYKEID